MGRKNLAGVFLLTGLLVAQPAAAQSEMSNPALFPDAPITDSQLELRDRADRFYAMGRYNRAFEIYLKGFAWRGDKYAQYMIGMMYWQGRGTSSDKVKAAAWLRLAAQRGNVKIMSARDQIWTQLVPSATEAANVEFETIRKEYGDRRVIRRLIQRDRNLLRASMANHATLRHSNLEFVYDDQGTRESGDSWYSTIQNRIEQRMGYLRGYVELGELVLIDDEGEDEDTESSPPRE